MTLRISSGSFVAGLVLTHGVVTESAPILRYMRGWSVHSVRRYCKRKHWEVCAQ